MDTQLTSLPIPWHLAPYRPILFPLLLGLLCLGLVLFERRRRHGGGVGQQAWYPPRSAAGAQLASSLAGTNLPIADMALQEERWADALRVLRSADPDPNDARSPFHMGLAFEHLGGWREAEACYRAAIEAELGHRDASYNLARLLAATGRVPDAISAYRRLLSHMPEDIDAWYNLGHLYFGLRLHGQALQAWMAAKQADPKAIDVHANLEMLERIARTLPAQSQSSSSGHP